MRSKAPDADAAASVKPERKVDRPIDRLPDRQAERPPSDRPTPQLPAAWRHGHAAAARATAQSPAERKGVLSVHGVEKSFVGRMVVKGVSLYVRKGEAVGLLGPNGAGKTTVFYMMTGLDQGR